MTSPKGSQGEETVRSASGVAPDAAPILFLAAFEPELAPLRERLGSAACFAAVGIGLAEAGAGAARALAAHRPRAVVLVGTAGGYPGAELPLGAVVVADASCLGDGAAVLGHGALVARMADTLAADEGLVNVVEGAGLRRVRVATTLSITTDDALATRLAHGTGAAAEHLETHAVALAARAAGVPWTAVLGITNDVGAHGREQWRSHHRATSDRVADVVASVFGPRLRAEGPVRLVLASTSRYRRALLDRLAVPYLAVAPTCDEDAWKGRGLAPEALARTLARAKAESVATGTLPAGAYVLGSDQLVDLDGEVLGKPGSVEAAIDQLARLAGREHRLVTALALRGPDGSLREFVDVHRLRMRTLPRDAFARYVARDRPLDCAGAYKIEEGGIALFESIEGADFTAIVGLPLLAVTRLLAEAGFVLP